MSKDNLMDYIGPVATQDTYDMFKATLADVQFPGYTFNLVFRDNYKNLYLQAEFKAPCAMTGRLIEQRSRKWQLSEFMTKSEIVQTALKCVLTAIEHEAREQFKYKGQAIFGPHFNVNDLVDLAKAGSKDVRL